MSNPSDLFRRAGKSGKKRCAAKPQDSAMFRQDRTPVPQPMQGGQPVQEAPQAARPVQQLRYPAGAHANYTALMRSHDRVHTRHIPKS